MRRLSHKNQKGFTIIELSIATAVFAVILMAAQAGFIEIGRMFYKGVSVTSTQNISTNIVSDLKNNIQLAANVSLMQKSQSGYTYYCVGNSRYTVNVGQEVDLSTKESLGPGGSYGLLRDDLPGASACAAPCDGSVQTCPSGTVAFNNPVELLGNKMRLNQFSITQPDASASPNLYSISLIAVYGDDQALDYTDKNDPTTVFCTGSLTSQQFCAVDRITSSAYRGVSS